MKSHLKLPNFSILSFDASPYKPDTISRPGDVSDRDNFSGDKVSKETICKFQMIANVDNKHTQSETES